MDDPPDDSSPKLLGTLKQEQDAEPPSYAVGYKKPPRHSRFKPGVSGNPAGRPRGRRSFTTELREILDAKVVVTENGRKAKVSTTFAMLMRLRQKALNGDPRSIDRLLFYAAAHLPVDQPGSLETLLAEDAEALKAIQDPST